MSLPDLQSRPNRHDRRGWLLAILLLAATILRFGCATGDLWLDEIWSLELVSQVTSPFEIVTDIRHDNNHLLNSIILYSLGPQRSSLVYRLPAILAGIAAVIVAGAIARRYGTVDQVVTVLCFGFSYIAIHYSTEARGYSFAVLFALLTYLALTHFFEQPGRRWTILFNLSVVLGILSHLSFLYVYAAALATSLVATPSKAAGRSEWSSRLLQLHTLPLISAAALYWLSVRGMELGGGPDYTIATLLVQVGSLILGGPTAGKLAVCCGAVAVTYALVGLMRMRCSGTPEWLFALLVMMAPVVYLLVAEPHFMFARYFLLASVFGLLAIARAIAATWNAGPTGRWLAGALLAIFLAANLGHCQTLVQEGRGQYSRALAELAQHGQGDSITIGSDHDHGIGKLVRFYAPLVAGTPRIEYCDAEQWPAEGVDWIILHEAAVTSTESERRPLHVQVHGQKYRHWQRYGSAILSGWRWHCYQRISGPSPFFSGSGGRG